MYLFFLKNLEMNYNQIANQTSFGEIRPNVQQQQQQQRPPQQMVQQQLIQNQQQQMMNPQMFQQMQMQQQQQMQMQQQQMQQQQVQNGKKQQRENFGIGLDNSSHQFSNVEDMNSVPQLDMKNSSPASFRNYILYIKAPQRATDEQGKIVIVDIDPASTKALQQIIPIEQDIWIEDVTKLPPNQIPPWLNGTPILLSTQLELIWKGTQCFRMIERLCSQPMGMTWGQEQAIGYNLFNGAPMDPYQSVQMSMDMSMYKNPGRVNDDDVQNYEQLRKMQTENWKKINRPISEAEKQAILSQMQTNEWK